MATACSSDSEKVCINLEAGQESIDTRRRDPCTRARERESKGAYRGEGREGAEVNRSEW